MRIPTLDNITAKLRAAKGDPDALAEWADDYGELLIAGVAAEREYSDRLLAVARAAEKFRQCGESQATRADAYVAKQRMFVALDALREEKKEA